jgi:uncharacterized integral membrane protein
MLDYWKSLSANEKFFLVLKFLIGLLFLIFIVRNWQSIEVNLVFFKLSLPLTLVILLSAGLGAFIASFWFIKKINDKNTEIKRLANKQLELEKSTTSND